MKEEADLLPLALPSASSINGKGSARTRVSFIRRLAVGCVVLGALGLLYVPAYHSAQGPLLPGIAQLPGWAFNTSRNLNTYIQPKTNTTILSPAEICAPPVPYLLIIVCSAVTNYNARMAIRNTWANNASVYDKTVRVAFLLGQSDNETLNDSVTDENLRFHDVIQEKFYDTYNNLTLKSVMMLKWVTKNCQKAKYLMKTDDDMYVNVPNLLKNLRARPKSTGTLIGSLICNARPISDPNNKWYAPKYMFSEKTYPNYLSGTGYVMSLDVAEKLYDAALSTPLLHLEDVYITGVCARYAKLRPTNHAGFSYVPRKLDSCTLSNSITSHKVSTASMHVIWKKLRDVNATSNCSEHSNPANKKSTTLNRNGRNVAYYFVKRRANNKCV
ncbi:beta-1,3-galactosyltransferase 1-like isoform X2 [Venturia canescens]|uniref:beta-1,3-galactosyltransferase 1-like isoform X2 n=1 Tax=Venturia canescens TaxID=32260 RepID=UPI001C9BCAB9|nr:beta-1,3-galactosyltransferase 1-like isoform X2 [Venturia canescens]